MLRLSLSVLVISLLAACSSVPPKSARSSSGMAITTPRAYAPPRGFPNFVDHSVGREEISIQAMSLVGVPYRWGGNTPDSGFDCSGLVRYVVDRAASVNLPRTTADMSSIGESIEPDGIAPGDLIFFNTSGRPHSHVGIYVGKLRFVNAPSTGGTVRLDYLTNPYWAKRFDGIRRVAAPKAKPAPFDAPTYQASRPPEPAPRVSPAAAAPAYAAVNAPAASAARAAAPSAPGYAANSATPAAARAAAPPPSSEYAAHSAAAMASAPASAAPLPNAVPAAATAATAATAADPYEPPPSAMSAARRQAQAAGARSPVLAAGNPGGAVPP
ncbi:C40 family peptidase, partial [Burkholderia pseudomallei]